MLTFPDLFKKIREESGLTQKDFAEKLQVSTILISMIESGQKEVSKNLIIKLSEILDVHPSSITPFLFADNNIRIKNLSAIEKVLIKKGEELQTFLIKQRSKNFISNAIEN